MQLSIRLESVAALVTNGNVLADIGTDHGYIPIELVRRGRVERAIAMDVREGPLLRARENIRRAGLDGAVETRLSDGAAALVPGEADRVVIAGMGGGLTVRILSEGEAVFAEVEELILQPQSELSRVREYLQKNGYRINDEAMVLDEGKYYPMMRAVRGEMKALAPEEALYGPVLIREKNPVLARFLEREEGTFERILEGLRREESENAEKRCRELEEKLALIQKAKARMGAI